MIFIQLAVHSDNNEVAEKIFQEHYLRPIGNDVRYVRLESGFRVKCLGYRLIFLGRNAQAKYELP
jgi:hypothetical protein